MNNTLKINLNDFAKIKEFISDVSKFESDIDLIKGRYVIDAKSTIGIFTLNLAEPVDIVIHSDNEKEIVTFNKTMKKYMA